MEGDWIAEVTELLEVLADRRDIEFLEVTKGDLQIRFRRDGVNPFDSMTVAAAGERIPSLVEPPSVVPQEGGRALGASPPVEVAGGRPADDPVRASAEEGGALIRSPMVGTFYRASTPGARPFVEVGSDVIPGMTVALVEAMKVFTSVLAQVDGVVDEIFVGNDEFVEFEQPLFRVRAR